MLRLLVLLLMTAPLLAAPTTKPASPFESAEPVGNVFYDDEFIRLPLRATAATVKWRVTDAWGVSNIEGSAQTTNGKVTLQLPKLPCGWFQVDVTDGDKAHATRLVVTTRYDLSKVIESHFGVMTHFAQTWQPDLIPAIARVGIKHVRDEVYWDAIEKEKGIFVFPPKFETFIQSLKEHHITPLVPMSFGNKLYYDVPGVPMYKAAPYKDEQFAGYARYCQEVLQHYGQQIQYVEIWNEYNGGFAGGPADGRPEVYRRMLIDSYKAIKSVRPDVKVLAGGTIGIPYDWLERVFQEGGIDHCDGISVHPYGYLSAPEPLEGRIQQLHELIRKHNNGQTKPVWVTEQGWYTTKPGENGNRQPITEHTKARYLVRAWTIFMANGVEKSFWYLGRNDQSFGTMGLFGKPDDEAGRYAPLPALAAYATLIRQLEGAKFVKREELPNRRVWCYLFRRGDNDIRVIWSPNMGVNYSLASPGPLEVTDLMGVTRTVANVDGLVSIGVTDSPLYVCGPVTHFGEHAVPLATPATRPAGSDVQEQFTPDIRRNDAGQVTYVAYPRVSLFRPRPRETFPTLPKPDAPQRTITVDGDPADWQGVPAMSLDEVPYKKLLAERKDKGDLGGTIQLAWDEQNLYLFASITDDVFDQTHNGYNTWKGDNLQLGISEMMPWTGGEWTRGTHEIALSQTPTGPEVFRGAIIELATLVVKREGTTTRYECSIPWNQISDTLPKAGEFSFSVYVNDADGAGRKGYAYWANIKKLHEMQVMRLVP